MNPDEGPDATAASDIPLAALLDGVVTCPHCRGWIESSARAYSGQTVACPHCNGHFQLPETIELGFVPPPAPLGITPPKEPWFYGFIDTYATVWMWLALLVTTLSILAAAAVISLRIVVFPGGEYAWIKAIFLAATVVVSLSGLIGVLLSVAFMLLALDIARNLRAIRQRGPDR